MDTKTVDPAIAQLTIRFKEKLSPMDTRVVTANVHRLNDEECASIIGGAAPPPRKPDADIIEGDDGPPPQPQLPPTYRPPFDKLIPPLLPLPKLWYC
jgi:hypothetical protein